MYVVGACLRVAFIPVDKVKTRSRGAREDSPDAGDADHRFFEILLGFDAFCRVEHSLTCTLRLGLGDNPAVAVHDRLVGACSVRRREGPAACVREAMAACKRRCWWSHRNKLECGGTNDRVTTMPIALYSCVTRHVTQFPRFRLCSVLSAPQCSSDFEETNNLLPLALKRPFYAMTIYVYRRHPAPTS